MTTGRALLIATAALTCTFAPTAAWAGNDLTGRNAQTSNKAYKGENLIRTDLPYVIGEAFVHPNQVVFDTNEGPWLAIGTYKSDGGNGCPNDYDAKWNIYVDGLINGQGFCQSVSSDSVSAGDSPTFFIEWTTCSDGNNGWALRMKGLTFDCRNNGMGHAERAQSFIEVIDAPTTRNADATFKNLRLKHEGVWQDFGGNDPFVASGYAVSAVRNSTDFDAYSPPLD